jgi:2-hydroxy-4-carboxymuconate semialdehyde hemiacetal dehydrogenase
VAGSGTAEEALAADVDAVVVASPNALHCDQTIAALRAGRDVLCEIPVALSLADADRVAVVERESGRHVMACHTQRYWPPYAELRRRVDAGELDLLHVLLRSCLLRRDNTGWTGGLRSWTDSVVWHHGAHLVDSALWLLGGEATDVSARAGRPHSDSGAPMDVAIAFRAAGGALASLVLSYNSALRVGDGVFIGVEETYRTDGSSLVGSRGIELDLGSAEASQAAAMLAQDGAFVDAALGRRPWEAGLADVRPAYAVLQQVHDSVGGER